MLKLKFILFWAILFLGAFLFAEKIPSWYEHADAVYPSEFYITAQGEGDSLVEAETECISKISLYFDTSVQLVNDLSRIQKETQDKNYSYESQTNISEKALVTSQSDFFCVQFEKSFKANGKYYAFSYIKRSDAFTSYEQRIKLNSGAIESLLLVAENYNNPIYGIEAAEKGIRIADVTEQYIKMAYQVKKTDDSYFSEAKALCKRIRNSYEICKANLIFQIEVENDFDGLIKRTIGKVLEKEGYNISETNGECQISVVINAREEELPAGFFLYGGIEVAIVTGTGEKVFSWSRNIPKTGAPNGRKEMAQKLMFQKMQKELEENFMNEFKMKVKK